MITLIASFHAIADNYLHLGMFSKHFEDKNYNEVHNLVGLEFDGYFLHRFKNSQGDATYFAGKIKRDSACLDNLCFGYSLGVMKGYNFKEYLPSLLGVISYEFNGFGADLSCFPTVVCAINFKVSDKAFDTVNLTPLWNAQGYLEVSLDHYDPDDPGRYGYSRNNGADYQLKLYITENAYMKWGYSMTDSTIKPDQTNEKFPVGWKTGKPSTLLSKGYFSGGYTFNFFSIGVSYNQATIQENFIDMTQAGRPVVSLPKRRHEGFGVHISKDYQLSDKTSIHAELAVIDTLITDTRITAELRHKLTKNIEITARTIDYEKWNSSHYQLGIRYRFN